MQTADQRKTNRGGALDAPQEMQDARMKLTPEKLTAFCAALAETCNVGKACAAVGIARQTAYDWRDEIPEFAAKWDRALKIGVSALEDEAHRRGFEGTEEPVYHLGKTVGTITKYSDTLAIFLLKAHDPEKYRERSSVDLQGSLQVSNMTDDEIAAEIAALTAAQILPALAAPVEDDGADLC